jgi:hypothetical protein
MLQVNFPLAVWGNQHLDIRECTRQAATEVKGQQSFPWDVSHGKPVRQPEPISKGVEMITQNDARCMLSQHTSN